MPAQADIIVSSPDSTEIRLVVETKLKIVDLRETEHQLKNYMLQMSCPLALLVTPQQLRVYRDRFTSYSEDSIELLGEFNIEGLIRFPSSPTLAQESGVAFENAVQSWLEYLSTADHPREGLGPGFREVIDHYILPAVESGVVRAAGPR
jgi:hypothetical protein